MKPRFLLLLSLILGATAAPANEKPVAGESITVTVVGTLQTGILAIGGETTGTTITARGVTWELDLGGDAALREAAEMLSGKTVIVQGTLERRSGVEIKERWIVTVTGLRAAGDAGAGTGRALGLLAAVGRTDTRISFQSEGGETVLDVTSDTGIDTATIRRKAEMWPERILVRLHLGGLESFEARSGDVAVEWSASSTGDRSSRVSLRDGGQETALGEANPYYTHLRIVGGNGEIPLEDGYFEVPLPAKLFEGNPREITLRWTDFFRS